MKRSIQAAQTTCLKSLKAIEDKTKKVRENDETESVREADRGKGLFAARGLQAE